MTATDRAFRGPLDDAPDPLARSLARETELLRFVATAHTDGYTAATTQARGLLAAAYADTNDRALLPGLEAATALLDRLRPAPHRIALLPRDPGVRLTVHCTAAEGAPCGVCDEHHDVSCDRDLVDGGDCLPAAWLNDTNPLDAYTGPRDRELASAPIAVRWSWEALEWQWLYVADLPDGDAGREWMT
jgi:hypothetical protein